MSATASQNPATDALFESLGLDQSEVANTNLDRLQDEIDNGGLVAPGKYHAMLTGAKPTEGKSSGRKGTELEFEILTGNFAGMKVRDTLWRATDADQTRTASGFKGRITMFANVLGLFSRGPKGNPIPVPGKTGFHDCLGAQCVIDVVIDESEFEGEDKRTGKKVTKTWRQNKLEHNRCPIYSVDAEKVKDVPKAGSVPAAPTANGSGSGSKAKEDYDAIDGLNL